jgi:GntP family gluconate:H+ symporter
MLSLLIAFIVALFLLIMLTVKYRWPPFFALCIAAVVVAIGVKLPIDTFIAAMKSGLGNTMQSLGLLIVLGTTLGTLLEFTRSTTVMAQFILKIVGEKNAALAMSLTGFLIGLPIFCDSGYIVLSGLNNTLAKKTGIPIIVLAVCLSTGLFAVHALVPPHPGILAAAGMLQVDIGKLLWMGIIVALPAMLTGYFWAIYAKNFFLVQPITPLDEEATETIQQCPSVISAFLPVILPILLIATKSVLDSKIPPTHFLYSWLVLGDPVVALTIGVLLSLSSIHKFASNALQLELQHAVEKAANILMITSAGGAFGSVLAATNIGNYVSQLPLHQLGLLFPFLIAAVLKTAQGSTTVAVITTASIVFPFLPALGLAENSDPAFVVLAMGAGSMVVSHPNDSYFWVVAKFSSIDIKPMLRIYTQATLWMGLVAMVIIYILHQLI